MSSNYDRRSCPRLRRGASGPAVVKLQKRLCAHHRSEPLRNTFVDGDFGPRTEQEVKRFQRESRLGVDGVVGRNTWTALLRDPGHRIPNAVGRTAAREDREVARTAASPRQRSSSLAERVFRALRRKGYEVLDDDDPFHLNIIGVRSSSNNIDRFDDRLILIYRDEDGVQHADEFVVTTDPGEYYTRTELLNKAGAAILVPGQYRDTYVLDRHQGTHEALCQRGGTVRVWRDGNQDDQLDRGGAVEEGWFGIDIHRARAGGRADRVGRYSAGCQVFQNAGEFDLLMAAARKSARIRGNRFTYTLLEESDLR